MDLQTMRLKVRDRKYVNRQEFLADVDQMAENSRLYNGVRSVLTVTVQTMMDIALERLAQVNNLHCSGTELFFSWHALVFVDLELYKIGLQSVKIIVILVFKPWLMSLYISGSHMVPILRPGHWVQSSDSSTLRHTHDGASGSLVHPIMWNSDYQTLHANETSKILLLNSGPLVPNPARLATRSPVERKYRKNILIRWLGLEMHSWLDGLIIRLGEWEFYGEVGPFT